MELKEKKKTRRSNGEGSIYYHEKKCSWIATIQYIDNNGILKRKSFQDKIKKNAQKKLNDFKKQMLLGEINESNILLKDYIQHYLLTYKLHQLKSSSYDTLDNVFRNHVKDSKIGNFKLSQIKPNDIQEFFNSKANQLINGRHLSESRLKKMREVLNGCFEQAILNGDLTKNPVARVKINQRDSSNARKEISIYSTNDKNKLTEVAYLKKDNGSPLFRYGAAFVLMLNTGIREGEACAIRNFDIKTINGQQYLTIGNNASFNKERDSMGNSLGRKLKLISPKTKTSYRDIPLNKQALNALNTLKLNNELLGLKSDFIICNKDGNMLNPRNLINCFNAITRRADVTNHGIHALRHTFASDSLRCGIDVSVVSKLLGHADIQTTYKIYIHIIDEQKVHAVNLLDKLYIQADS